MTRALVECVPNFSEGRDKRIIGEIAEAISGIAGVALLGTDSGLDANRTVYTFVGPPDATVDAAVAAAAKAYELIDMSVQRGAHPRMGALDVCPFVPVVDIDLGACVELAREAAERIGKLLGVPVYLYEAAASRPERKSLAYLRSGGYEALPAKLASPDWVPDFGPATFVPRWGASAVGARDFLIAYNVDLDSRDVEAAKEIARRIRESGRCVAGGEGGRSRLAAVRAIGWYLESYGCAQVSVNLLDFRITPLHAVFEAVKEEAEALGLRVTGSEIVGLVPLEPLAVAGRRCLETEFGAEAARAAREEELVEAAVRSLGLASRRPFESAERILERAVRAAVPGMLPPGLEG